MKFILDGEMTITGRYLPYDNQIKIGTAIVRDIGNPREAAVTITATNATIGISTGHHGWDTIYINGVGFECPFNNIALQRLPE